MSRRYPEWDIEGKDWPNREASRFVDADSYHWHVQEAGPNEAVSQKTGSAAADAPVCLLIHGTGAATHSWRDLMPLLAKHYRVIAVDLPGHGFTRSSYARRVSLPGMATSIGVLLDELEVTPDAIIGHSAGAAIGLQLLLDREWVVPLVGLNPALLPFPGLAAKLFPSLAKVLFTNPFVSRIFARMARAPGETERFLRKSTGSQIDHEGLKHYRRILTRSGHCDGAIRMMASWQLEGLKARMPEVSTPVLLIHASNDKAIPPSAVREAGALIPGCVIEELEGLGHLAHEEKPEQVASLITDFIANSKA